MAAVISASVSAGLPAFGGIAPLPFTTEACSASMPVLMRGAQAALSPGFGALATPAVWHTVHTLSYTALPSAAALLSPFCAAGAGFAFDAGSLKLAPDWFAM